jgi:hypothetical protein
MSKLDQSMDEMFGATIELDCQRCPRLEADGDGTHNCHQQYIMVTTPVMG